MGIVDELADMFPDSISYQAPGTFDGWGDDTPAAAVSIPCYIEGENKIVRDAQGIEKVSTVQAILAGVFGVKVGGVFTLPARFSPNKPEAISIEFVSDEDGAHHEVVMF
jgi:hypothetical protein